MEEWRWVQSNGGMAITKENRALGKILKQCHFFHHKSYTGWLWIEAGAPR
jgi:hypothetical protein